MIIYRYFILFLMYAFGGWLMEVLVGLYNNHKFVNRGFLIGPYCPIYGYGCLLMTILLNKYTNDPIALFIMAIVICSLLEYFTSYFMEKIFHARWWDYSQKKFNLNGRICLETMVPFGILGCIVIYIINPFFNSIIDLIPVNILHIVAIILFIIFLIDNVLSIKVMSNLKHTAFNVKKDNTEEITHKVREILSNKNLFNKRLVDAFPNLQILVKRTQERIKQTREEINLKKKQINKIQKEVDKKEKQLRKMNK